MANSIYRQLGRPRNSWERLKTSKNSFEKVFFKIRSWGYKQSRLAYPLVIFSLLGYLADSKSPRGVLDRSKHLRTSDIEQILLLLWPFSIGHIPWRADYHLQGLDLTNLTQRSSKPKQLKSAGIEINLLIISMVLLDRIYSIVMWRRLFHTGARPFKDPERITTIKSRF